MTVAIDEHPLPLKIAVDLDASIFGKPIEQLPVRADEDNRPLRPVSDDLLRRSGTCRPCGAESEDCKYGEKATICHAATRGLFHP